MFVKIYFDFKYYSTNILCTDKIMPKNLLFYVINACQLSSELEKKKMWLRFSCVLFPGFVLAYGANILGIIPTPSYSHQVAFQPLWKELSLRGHKVTTITTDPIGDPSLRNLTEIDINWTYSFMNYDLSSNVYTMWDTHSGIILFAEPITKAILSTAEVLHFMRNQKFDIVLVEFQFPEFLGLAEMYGCPKILVSPILMPEALYSRFGNPSHPVLNPDFGTPFHGALTFWERLTSAIYYLHVYYLHKTKFFIKKQRLIEKHFNVTRNLEDIVDDVDMLFINSQPLIHGARALGPATIEIGSIVGRRNNKDISRDVKEFLDGAKDGFVYFSLGSNVKSKDLKKETLVAIIDTLKNLPYRVLWKFEADELPGKPENVKLIKWAPQQTVLSHPNIKLFVTQGGLQSMEEAIYSEVPLVVIPFFGDQEQNAKLMQSKGIAIIVEVRPYLDKDALKSAMLEVIKNPKYRSAVSRLKQLALDTPMTGLEKAVWWTEYVIRNKGAKHLRNPAADIPWYQYFLLDVIGFLLLVATISITIVVISIKWLFRFISSKISGRQVKVSKKLN